MTPVAFKMLPHGEGLVPTRATAGAAGFDLHAAIPEDDGFSLGPSARALVPTGFSLALPQGLEGQVRPRSSLASRHGLTVLNSPGTIDWDYRGEVFVSLINLGHQDVPIRRGLRIAQLVIAPVALVSLVPADSLDDTTRGAGGFGSTGQ